MATNRFNQDYLILNRLLGKALLDDDIHETLLRQSTRMRLIATLDLSPEAQQYLASLADLPQLDELAAQLVTTEFYRWEGTRTSGHHRGE